MVPNKKRGKAEKSITESITVKDKGVRPNSLTPCFIWWR